MQHKEEATWETIVLAGDASTWKADDWQWDSTTLTARSKRRSARLEDHSALKPASACRARARLASHLESDSQTVTPGAGPEQEVQELAVQSNDSSSSSRCGSGRQSGSAGGKAVRSSKAQLATRRAVCQADGCNRDLTTLTYYHQRNRICEVHIKALVFCRDGVELRFCQRCGNSHPLHEFDEGKHSCRKQLAKHNARRRKQQASRAATPKDLGCSTAALREEHGMGGGCCGDAGAGLGGLQPGFSDRMGLSTIQEGGPDPLVTSPSASSSSPGSGRGTAAAAAAAAAASLPSWCHVDPAVLGGPPADREGSIKGARKGGAPGAAAGAAAAPGGSAQARLAARIAKLTGGSHDLHAARQQQQQGRSGALPPPACATLEVPAEGSCEATAALQEELEPPLFADLADDLFGAGGVPDWEEDARGGDSSLERPMSPLLPLLDFDLSDLSSPVGVDGAADPAVSALANDLDEWITGQLGEHSMLGVESKQAQHAQQREAGAARGCGGGCAFGGSSNPMLMSLFDDVHDLHLPLHGEQVPAAAQQQVVQPQQPPALQQLTQQLCAPAGAVGGGMHGQGAPAQQQGSFALASNLMGAGQPAVAGAGSALAGGGVPHHHPPAPQATLAKVSVKLFGCTPEELPPDLRQQVSGWFGAGLGSMEGYIRPGCVHLTVQAVLQQGACHQGVAVARGTAVGIAGGSSSSSNGEDSSAGGGAGICVEGGAQSVRAVLSSMLRSGGGLWRHKTLLIQVGGELGLVHRGALRTTWDVRTAAARRAVPQVDAVSPPVVLSGTPGEVTLRGVNLLQDDCQLLARMHGQYLPLPEAGCRDCCCQAKVAGGGEEGREGWEQRCCGCCTSKLQPGPGSGGSPAPPQGEGAAHAGPAEAGTAGPGSGSSCCAGGSSTQAQGGEPLPADSSSSTKEVGGGGGGGVEVVGVSPAEGGCCRRGNAGGEGEGESGVEAAAPHAQQGPAEVQQSVRVVLPAELATGLLFVDVQRGAFSAPQGARLLVVDDEAVQRELLAMQHLLAPRDYAPTLDQFGVVYSWWGGRREEGEWAVVERTAASLLYWCTSCGLVATAGALLRMLVSPPLTSPPVQRSPGLQGTAAPGGRALAESLGRAHRLACHDGLSLLHRAVQSRSMEMVEAVLGWGHEAGSPWKIDEAGPLGLTPLHLAATHPDPPSAAALLELLLLQCTGGAATCVTAWHSALTADGLTPAQFAARAGTAAAAAGILRRLAAEADGWQQEGVRECGRGEEGVKTEGGGPQPALSVPQPSTPRRCRCTGDCPCAQATHRCAWCTGDDSAAQRSMEDTAGSGPQGRVVACGLPLDGKCGCCGAGASGVRKEGWGHRKDGEGGGGDGMERGRKRDGGGGGDGKFGRKGGCCGGGPEKSVGAALGGGGGGGGCCEGGRQRSSGVRSPAAGESAPPCRPPPQQEQRWGEGAVGWLSWSARGGPVLPLAGVGPAPMRVSHSVRKVVRVILGCSSSPETCRMAVVGWSAARGRGPPPRDLCALAAAYLPVGKWKSGG